MMTISLFPLLQITLVGLDHYSKQEQDTLSTIGHEAADFFPVGKSFESPQALRDAVRAFAHKKGFAVSSDDNYLYCSRGPEPTSVPMERRRIRPGTLVSTVPLGLPTSFLSEGAKQPPKPLRFPIINIATTEIDASPPAISWQLRKGKLAG